MFALIALAALAASIAFSPQLHLFDEPYYLKYAELFQRFGLSETAIRHLPGSPGPLVGLIFWWTSPLTSLQAQGLRWVNFALLIATLGILAATGRRLSPQSQPQGSLSPWRYSLALLSIPMIWPMAGLALSDIGAVFFLSLAAHFLVCAFTARSLKARSLWTLGAGIALGLASLGRQPVLAALPVPFLVSWWGQRRFYWQDCGYLVALLIPAPCFWLWKGLMPPSPLHINAGLSIQHLVISWGYAGILLALLAPHSLLSVPRRLALAFAGAGFAGSLALGVVFIRPFSTLATRFLPGALMPAYVSLSSALVAGFALACFAAVLTHLWRSRDHLPALAGWLGVALIASTPLLILNGYSSRYTALAAPFFLLATSRSARTNWLSVLVLIVALSAGFVSLQVHYSLEPWMLPWAEVLGGELPAR